MQSLKGDIRDLAQLVAHTSGGREVAGSSPVIPTFSSIQIRTFLFIVLIIVIAINTDTMRSGTLKKHKFAAE